MSATKNVMLKLGDHTNENVRALAIDLDQRIVLKTPVDTGRARSNWLVGLGVARRETIQSQDQSGAHAIQEGARTIAQSKPYQNIWISNNLPYIGELEVGHSRQAPTGMVRQSISEALSVAGNR